MLPNSTRLNVVDALRGFAIVSIMLLHNIEHFDYYFTPTNLPAWMPAVDKWIWDTLFFMFGGKSYAIFALLFGLTFFIQFNNQEKKGKDFRGRFAWRLVLLLGFGILNSAFYQGDILTIYALIGFVLIPVARLGDRAVFWIAVVLMFQPYEWINFFQALQQTDFTRTDPVSWSYFGKMTNYITGTSILDTWVGNLTNGRPGVLLWTWENGRVFQTASLFMFGMLAGRKNLFVPSPQRNRFWVKILLISIALFIGLYSVKAWFNTSMDGKAIHQSMLTILTSWTNMAFMVTLVSGFFLLFHARFTHPMLNIFSPLGRMSLSNYIMQSFIGSFIYYGFGLGLYQYTGSTYCLLIGIALALFQGFFSWWWMKNHKQGPLETIWHKGTWIGSR